LFYKKLIVIGYNNGILPKNNKKQITKCKNALTLRQAQENNAFYTIPFPTTINTIKPHSPYNYTIAKLLLTKPLPYL